MLETYIDRRSLSSEPFLSFSCALMRTNEILCPYAQVENMPKVKKNIMYHQRELSLVLKDLLLLEHTVLLLR